MTWSMAPSADMPSDAPLHPREHLAQLDIVRIAAFVAVIAVHAIDFTQGPANAFAAGTLMVLQFGREVFFALTGFVLVHSVSDGPVEPLRFWRRRIPAILVPYLAWTAVYEVQNVVSTGPRPLSVIVWDIITGGAQYQLYFLVVTIQLYLVFPWLVRAVRRTRRRAGWILATVGTVNMAWLAALHDLPAPHGWAAGLWTHGYELLPTYAIYVVGGCYAALHRHRIDAVIEHHRRRIIAGAVALAASGLVAFAVQLGPRAPRDAGSVLQPAMVLVSVAAGIVLYVTGRRWARGPQRGGAAVRAASDISFGVYLAHPLVLTVILSHGFGYGSQVVPSTVATLIAGAGCAVGAVVISWVLRETPLSLLFTGRPRRRRPPLPAGAVSRQLARAPA